MAEWYYLNNGQQQGPVTGAQLKALAVSGSLGPEDLVWNESMKDWAKAGRVRGLKFADQTVAAPAPQPVVHHHAQAAEAAAPEPAEESAPPPQEEQAVPQTFEALPASSDVFTQIPAPAASLPAPLAYSSPSGEAVTPRAIDLLRQTKPWVRIVAIIIFIYVALIALVAVGSFFVMAFGIRSAGGVIAGSIMAITYLIVAAIMFFPGFFLWRYASSISRFQASGRGSDLEASSSWQKNYWLFVGILVLLGALGGLATLVPMVVLRR